MAKDPKRVKIGKSSKLKGSNYERKVANLLEKWFQKYDPECSIARTPQSGGHSKLASDWDMAGDIVCSNNDFPFGTVECKNQESWSLKEIFTFKGTFYSFWKQANKQCSKGKVPLLVFTKNYHPDFIALPADKEFGRILIYSGGANPTLGFHDNKLVPDGMIICLLDALLKTDPKEWITATNAYYEKALLS